jgi:hypothetical protein
MEEELTAAAPRRRIRTFSAYFGQAMVTKSLFICSSSYFSIIKKF